MRTPKEPSLMMCGTAAEQDQSQIGAAAEWRFLGRGRAPGLGLGLGLHRANLTTRPEPIG
jgi:hypothetical protein